MEMIKDIIVDFVLFLVLSHRLLLSGQSFYCAYIHV